MADNDKQILGLDLDAKGFINSALEAKKSLQELGEIENIAGMLEGFATLGVALGAAGTAIYALKKGFDFTLEAEAIKRVSDQFELLAENAGVVPSRLKDGLEKAVDGFADMDDVLKAANKSIVELGDNANRIPEIMELSRKVTAVFGGELIENYEKISQAVASGNVRSLRQYGLIIDQEKAMRAYANSIGKYVSDLTEADKKTAILNATLEKGNTALKGAKEDTNSLTVSWQKLKVGIKELGDFVILKYEQIFGSNFRTMVSMASDAVKGLATTLTAKWGDGIEKTRAQAEKLRETVKDKTEELEKAERMYVKYGTTLNGIYNNYKGKYEAAKKALQESKDELQKYDTYLEKREQMEKEREAKETKKTSGGGDKRETEIKFNQDLLKLQEARLNEQIALETNYDELQKQRAEQKALMAQELNTRLLELDQRAQHEGTASLESIEQQKMEIRNKYALDLQKLNQDMMNDQIKAAEQAAKVSTKSADGFAKGWKLATLNAGRDFKNYVTLGQRANEGLTKSLSAGFKAMGDGSENAAEAMKKAFLGQIGDEAMARGEFLLASSLWPPQPLGLVAGGALVALGAKLKSLAGSGGGGVGASSGGGGGPSIETPTPQTAETLQKAEEAKPKRAVTIQVQGNYFETEQTKRTLMEMIRSETDATDFSYVQINQGGIS